MNSTDFYSTLDFIEQAYWHKLAELFQLVNPRKPQKGMQALILRAQKASEEKQTPREQELEAMFQAAKERTLRRVELLNQCQISKPPTS